MKERAVNRVERSGFMTSGI